MRIAATLFTAISGLALATAVPAAAESTRTVKISQPNLSSPADMARLERRIEHAARSLCAVDPMLRSAAIQDEERRCRAETVAAARTQMEQRATRMAGI